MNLSSIIVPKMKMPHNGYSIETDLLDWSDSLLVNEILELSKVNDFYYDEFRIVFNVLEKPPRYCMIAVRKEGKLVGFSLISHNNTEISTDFLLIDKNHQRHGLGRICMITTMGIQISNGGCHKLVCETEKPDALRFFIKNGYKVKGLTKSRKFLKMELGI